MWVPDPAFLDGGANLKQVASAEVANVEEGLDALPKNIDNLGMSHAFLVIRGHLLAKNEGGGGYDHATNLFYLILHTLLK